MEYYETYPENRTPQELDKENLMELLHHLPDGVILEIQIEGENAHDGK